MWCFCRIYTNFHSAKFTCRYVLQLPQIVPPLISVLWLQQMFGEKTTFIALHSDSRMFSSAYKSVIYLPMARCRRNVRVLIHLFGVGYITSQNKSPAKNNVCSRSPLSQYRQKCPEQKGNSLTTKKTSPWQFLGPQRCLLMMVSACRFSGNEMNCSRTN